MPRAVWLGVLHVLGLLWGSLAGSLADKSGILFLTFAHHELLIANVGNNVPHFFDDPTHASGFDEMKGMKFPTLI